MAEYNYDKIALCHKLHTHYGTVKEKYVLESDIFSHKS